MNDTTELLTRLKAILTGKDGGVVAGRQAVMDGYLQTPSYLRDPNTLIGSEDTMRVRLALALVDEALAGASHGA